MATTGCQKILDILLIMSGGCRSYMLEVLVKGLEVEWNQLRHVANVTLRISNLQDIIYPISNNSDIHLGDLSNYRENNQVIAGFYLKSTTHLLNRPLE